MTSVIREALLWLLVAILGLGAITAYDYRLKRDRVKPGTRCANCVNVPATHMGRIDLESGYFPLCDGCPLPVNEERGGYEMTTVGGVR